MRKFGHVFLMLSLTGCYRTRRLAPPPQPAKTVPNVSMSGEPGEGLARVVLDSTSGSALVEKVSGGSIGGVAGATVFSGTLEMRSRLCTTPCVVDMSPGPYELRFTSVADPGATSSAFINVDNRASIYRHALGRQESNAWKGFLGWPLAGVGGFSLAVGAATAGGGGDGSAGAAIGFGIIGAVLGGLGAYLIHGSIVIEQPGSGVQWHLGE